MASVRAYTSATPPADLLYDGDLGTITEFDPQTGDEPPAEAAGDETDTYDFNGDDEVDSTTLMDVNGETTLITVAVADADVVFTNLQYPVYAENAGENNYVIGQAYSIGVLNIGIDEEIIWSIDSSKVSFDAQTPGTASLLSDGTLLCACPTLGKVLQIVPSTEAIIFSHTPQHTPVFAARNADGNTIVVESDGSEAGLNSRVYEIDDYQDVIKEWGLGRLRRPTGVSVLANGNWLISC